MHLSSRSFMQLLGCALRKSNRSRLVAGLSGFAAVVSLGASSARAADYIVKLKDFKGASNVIESVQNQMKSEPVSVQQFDSHAPGSLLGVSIKAGNDIAKEEALKALLSHPDVAYVVPNIKMHMVGTPNDPSFTQQWALTKINAPQAWDMTTGSRDVVVAVIDTGVDYTHGDLAANMWTNTREIPGNGIDDDGNGYVDDVRGWDFFANDNDPKDETSAQNPGHGTHCSGIIGAVGNNGTGISGISQQVSIMPVRFLGADGSGDLLNGIKAIDYAIAAGAQVISASWGAKSTEDEAKPLVEAVERANQKGVIFVVAAGNDGVNNDSTGFYPANAPVANVINVAASGNSDGKPSWSNFGTNKVHVSSPGENIYSTLPNNSYGNLSGTSMATPLVAGMVALLKSQDRNLSGLEARSILQSTGDQVAIETACKCRINAPKALQAVRARTLTVIPAALTLAPAATQQFSAYGGRAPYSFTSSNTGVATISSSGALTAAAIGDTTITTTDAQGRTATSLAIHVSDGTGGGGGGGGGDCPLGDPTLCQAMCQILPTLPWCH